jgi:hypothetical protein
MWDSSEMREEFEGAKDFRRKLRFTRFVEPDYIIPLSAVNSVNAVSAAAIVAGPGPAGRP